MYRDEITLFTQPYASTVTDQSHRAEVNTYYLI